MKKKPSKPGKRPKTGKRGMNPVEGQSNLISPATSSASEPTIGARLAAFLTDRQEEIISEFSAAVHHDSKVQTSETLSEKQLTKHIPQLLDQLAETLCNAFSQEVKEDAAYTAATRGHQRWQKGYDLSELLRELALLRSELIRQLVAFLDQNPGDGGASRLFVMTTIHRFLDDSMRVSVEQFMAAQERAQLKDDVASASDAASPPEAGRLATREESRK